MNRFTDGINEISMVTMCKQCCNNVLDITKYVLNQQNILEIKKKRNVFNLQNQILSFTFRRFVTHTHV